MLTGTRILIVDEEEVLADNLCQLFTRHGAEPRIAHTPSRAIATVGSFAPHLALIDHRLAGLDGLQTWSELRARAPACQCLLMSANPTDDLRARAVAAGILQVVAKPFGLAEIVTIMSRHGVGGLTAPLATDFATAPANALGVPPPDRSAHP